MPQLAWADIALAIPESAARFAFNVRFLQKQGLASPRRLGMLIGGNLGAEFFLAMALGAFARSPGYPVGIVELLFINVSASLLAGLLPIPGGIGIVESGLTLGLVRAGLPEDAALAPALLDRSATFYLPPLWGFFAVRWMERRQLLRPVRRRSPL